MSWNLGEAFGTPNPSLGFIVSSSAFNIAAGGTNSPYASALLQVWAEGGFSAGTTTAYTTQPRIGIKLAGLPTVYVSSPTADQVALTYTIPVIPFAGPHSFLMVCDATLNCAVYLDGMLAAGPVTLTSRPKAVLLGSPVVPTYDGLSGVAFDVMRVSVP
jgi:hypothetical protein